MPTSPGPRRPSLAPPSCQDARVTPRPCLGRLTRPSRPCPAPPVAPRAARASSLTHVRAHVERPATSDRPLVPTTGPRPAALPCLAALAGPPCGGISACRHRPVREKSSTRVRIHPARARPRGTVRQRRRGHLDPGLGRLSDGQPVAGLPRRRPHRSGAVRHRRRRDRYRRTARLRARGCGHHLRGRRHGTRAAGPDRAAPDGRRLHRRGAHRQYVSRRRGRDRRRGGQRATGAGTTTRTAAVAGADAKGVPAAGAGARMVPVPGAVAGAAPGVDAGAGALAGAGASADTSGVAGASRVVRRLSVPARRSARSRTRITSPAD